MADKKEKEKAGAAAKGGDNKEECAIEEKKPDRDIKQLIEQAQADRQKRKESGQDNAGGSAPCCTEWHRLGFFAIPLALIYLPWLARTLRCPPKCCPPSFCCPRQTNVCPPEKLCCGAPPGTKRQCEKPPDLCQEREARQ